MESLIKIARKDPRILLIVGDLGFSVVEKFEEEFPDRFINAGIAEQNMMGLAAGLASEGFMPFVYSIGNFPTFRCAEQIRNDVDYHELPVVVVAVGGGLAYGNLGYSHHAIQDFALMRSFPNMTIAAPGDPLEVHSVMDFLVAQGKPSYLRLAKAGEQVFHSEAPTVGKGDWLHISGNPDSKKVILTTGANLTLANKLRASDKYRDYAVFSLPLWGRADKSTQAHRLQELERITTLEDHLVDGGFGSWVLESANLAGNSVLTIEILGIGDNLVGRVGSHDFLEAIRYTDAIKS